MIATPSLRSEIEDLLEEADKRSVALQHLIRATRKAGSTSPEMAMKIREANKYCEEANRNCEEAMQRYTYAYLRYYKLCRGDN